MPSAVGPLIFLQQIFFQRTGVDADTDRNLALRSRFDDFFDIFARADVAGIEAQTVDALLDGDQRQLVIEMDVGDQRNANAFS